MSLLNKQNLSQANQNNVLLPDEATYQLPEKVLQFGTGVLLRGLTDYFIDKANRQGLFKGRAVVIKSTPGSTNDFAKQDNLYTLNNTLSNSPEDKPAQPYVISSAISRVLSAHDDWAKIKKAACQPELGIVVSNTTEVGISYVEEALFGEAAPDSFPAKLTALLHARYEALGGDADTGWVIVPCELIVDNGRKLADMVNRHAARHDLSGDFMNWLDKHNHFCNSLVDRIVPGKPAADKLQNTEQQIGYQDKLLTLTEWYRFWAIEGNQTVKDRLTFAAADPAGVVITEDISIYRERKLRLLNGTHTISVPLAFMSGFDKVHECMQDETMAAFFQNLMTEETIPATPVPEKIMVSFADDVLRRFANPDINHKLISITLQLTAKMKMRVVDTLLRHYQNTKTVPKYHAQGFAGYLQFMKCRKTDDGKFEGQRTNKKGQTESYPVQDDLAAYFADAWQEYGDDTKGFVKKVLSDTYLWGTSLYALPGFADEVTAQLQQLK